GGARIRQVIADIAAGDSQRSLIPQAAAADRGDVAGDGGVGNVGGSLNEDGPAAVAAVGGVGCERAAANRRRRVRGLHADGPALGRGGIARKGTVGDAEHRRAAVVDRPAGPVAAAAGGGVL